VPLEKRHPEFERIRTDPASIGGRRMMAEVFDWFEDKDGNFVREFQKASLDARPLFRKLQKRYWELPHVAGLPFVIAIEAFHDTTSLFYPGGVLAKYLYGLDHFPTFTEDGQLLIGAAPIASHDRPGKTPIPSNSSDNRARSMSARSYSATAALTRSSTAWASSPVTSVVTSRSFGPGRAGTRTRTQRSPCCSGTTSVSARRWRRGGRGGRCSTTQMR
jgi:hypothetical protein